MISFFNLKGDLVKIPDDEEDKKIAEKLSKALKGDESFLYLLSSLYKEIVEIRINDFAREAIESLFFCDDISLKEMSKLLELDEDILDEYGYWFCNVSELKSYFKKKTYIETEISKTIEKLTKRKNLNKQSRELLEKYLKSLLFKRWALLLGKEFVIWKFGLKKIEVNTNTFFEIISKEAFFYYKEIAVSEKEIDPQEFTKITNSLVKTLKEINGAMSQNGASDNLIYDIKKALGIAVIEENPVEVPLIEGEIISNSKVS